MPGVRQLSFDESRKEWGMSTEQQMLEAVKSGDAAGVNALLNVNPSLVNAKNENGVSAILLATYFGHRDIAEVLFAKGAELNIFEAAATGQLDRVQTITEEDAELVNSYSSDGFKPLGLAAFFGRKEVLDFLLAHGANPNCASKNQMRVMPIHSAVAHRQPELALAMVESLLLNGAEVNVAQDGGWTPLHQAAAHGQVEIMKLLLAHGASVNAKSEDGTTPLQMAQNKGYPEAVEMLWQHGVQE
jgi:ankyrin repeat protein